MSFPAASTLGEIHTKIEEGQLDEVLLLLSQNPDLANSVGTAEIAWV